MRLVESIVRHIYDLKDELAQLEETLSDIRRDCEHKWGNYACNICEKEREV